MIQTDLSLTLAQTTEYKKKNQLENRMKRASELEFDNMFCDLVQSTNDTKAMLKANGQPSAVVTYGGKWEEILQVEAPRIARKAQVCFFFLFI